MAATASNAPRARLLDISRLVSRGEAGTLTGVDRVERAYLSALVAAGPVFGLLKTKLGYLIVSPDGMTALDQRWEAQDWPPADLLGRVLRRKKPTIGRIEALLRAHAVARTPSRGLARTLRRSFPDGVSHINVGHSFVDADVMSAVRAGAGTVAVMIHDVIPLEFPETQKPRMVAKFRAQLAAIVDQADLVIYNSADSQTRAEAQMQTLGQSAPRGLVAHLGIDPPNPDPAGWPADLDKTRPYYCVLGTIEPRKNIGFLLDLWAELATELGDDCPTLCLIGRRGWMVEDIAARLDAAPAHVTDLGGLGDGARDAVLAGAQALLMPSLAEGFGLPPFEAAALGVPVICNPLPVYQELLGDWPIYAGVNDTYDWKHKIMALRQAGDRPARAEIPLSLPTWQDHFSKVLPVI